MEIEIRQTPNSVKEIVRLIYNAANEDLQQHFHQEDKVNLETFFKKECTNIKKYNSKFKKLLVLDDKAKHLYFLNISEKTACVAEILIHNFDMDLVRKLYDCIDSYDEDFLRKELILGINGEFEDEILQKGGCYEALLNNLSILNFIDLLDEIDIKEDVKWKLVQVYKNPTSHYRELAGIILNNEEAYKTAYKEVSQLVEEFIEDFQKNPENKCMNLQEIIGFKLNNNKVIIYPTVAKFYAVTFNLKDECDIWYYGILFDKLLQTSRSIENGKGQIINVLKSLSDKSKFEIIRLLKNEEMYGQQIAEKLKLTTATVSYHMNDLVGANLVFLERRDSRIYYSLNKEAIKEFIVELEKYML